jgi:hypothetical protein
VPLTDMHRSVAAEAGTATMATIRPVPASTTAPRRLARRRVRFMLRSPSSRVITRGHASWSGGSLVPVGCRTAAFPPRVQHDPMIGIKRHPNP